MVARPLEFLLTVLLRATPHESLRKRQESFPDEAGTANLISRYETETVLLLMLAGPSVFLSGGDGYVGELLELQHWFERAFWSSRGKV